MDRGSLEKLQLARLGEILARVKNSVYYGKRFAELGLDTERIRTLADLERLPLTKAGMTVTLSRVLAVVIPDQPGGLDKLTQLLFVEGVNINNAYGFVLEGSRKAIFVVNVDQIEKAEKLLEKKSFQTLDAEALSAVEPFHYMKY